MRLSSSFFILAQALLASLAFVAAETYPNPLPGSDDIKCRDPAMLYNPDTKTYYMFSTGRGVHIFKAPSITGPWSHSGEVMPNCSIVENKGHCELWAADVAKLGDQYVLYYSSSAIGSQDSVIGVATSPTMDEGSWTDHGEVMRSDGSKPFNSIDPNIIDDGGLKLTYGSYWDGMFQVDMVDFKTPANRDYTARHLAGSGGRPAEGGFVYKSPDSKFYFMFFSDGITPLGGATSNPEPGKEYKVRVGRGDGPSGPFFDKTGDDLTTNMDPPSGWIVLGSHDNVYAPGGQAIFRDPVSNRDVIAYHYVKADGPIGGPSYLGINYLDFSSDWPVVVDLPPVAPAPDPEPAPEPEPTPAPPTPTKCSKKAKRSRAHMRV
ncbi:glycoside hydrolase family 43 protein [Auricularia subglabra TFB-10046 SS5]|nr:glycoside hydrolase family 43 protein [Auricularia subglabra TFB-10046 SS5]